MKYQHVVRQVKPFSSQGEYFQVHNLLVDYMLPRIKPTSFKLLMFIIRKTSGWQKAEDRISFSQLQKGTGVKSRTTVSQAIQELIDNEFIVCHRVNDGINSNLYALNFDLSIQVEYLGTSKIEVLQNLKGGTSKIEDTERHVHKDNSGIDEKNIQFLAQIIKFDLGGTGDHCRTARRLYFQHKDSLSLEEIARMACEG